MPWGRLAAAKSAVKVAVDDFPKRHLHTTEEVSVGLVKTVLGGRGYRVGIKPAYPILKYDLPYTWYRAGKAWVLPYTSCRVGAERTYPIPPAGKAKGRYRVAAG